MTVIKRASTLAPKWFRKLRRIVYLLTSGSMVTGTLTELGFSDKHIVLIIGWIMLGLEALNILLVESDDENVTAQPNENNG